MSESFVWKEYGDELARTPKITTVHACGAARVASPSRSGLVCGVSEVLLMARKRCADLGRFPPIR